MQPALEVMVVNRLPLAESLLLLWKHICDSKFLEELFEEHRGACYTKILTFSLTVNLIADALVQHQGSARKSFQRSQENGELEVSLQATYEKLGRLPLTVSEAFLAESTDRLVELIPTLPAETVLPASVQAFQVTILDGKALKRVPKRLKPLRNSRGGVLGGKALVAVDMASGLAMAMATDPDGETNEAKLVPQVLPQVRSRRSPVLWVADRQFADLTQTRAFVAREGDHFLVRYHPKTAFVADPQRPPCSGTDSRRRHYVQEWGYLGRVKNKQRRYVRRITLSRPGEEEIILVTDLLEAETYPAADLLEVYRKRWKIEQVFQVITEVFCLQRLIGTTPQGTIFQLSFCLLLYNMIQVMRAYIASGAGELVEQVSTELLFDDVRRQLIALHEVLKVESVVRLFAEELTAEQVCRRLQVLLSGLWTERWRKATSRTRKLPTAKNKKREHTSAYRLLQKYRLAQKKEDSGSKSP